MNRREQLLDVALGLIDERGVRGASMRELARRAGVDVRSAYYHFESKRDLLRALFERAGDVAPLVEPVTQEVLDALHEMRPVDALVAVIDANLDRLQRGAAHNRLIHAELLYGDEDAAAVGDELWKLWGALLEKLLAATGVVASEQLPAFTRTVRSLLWGVFNESQLTGELDDPKKRRARARELARSLTANATAR
jgi:AcrR family transcriptional regulator